MLKIPIFILSILLCARAFAAQEYSLSGNVAELQGDEDGVQVTLSGYGSIGSSGDPDLPQRIINIGLPPWADMQTVSVSVVSVTSYDEQLTSPVRAYPPLVAHTQVGTIVEWGAGKVIVDGKNTDVYGQDAFYPAAGVTAYPTGQIRKWKFVPVGYNPVLYNPVQGVLRYITAIRFRIEYGIDDDMYGEAWLDDTAIDDAMADFLYNYTEARTWYATSPVTPRFKTAGVQATGADTSRADYVIVTTEEIAGHLTRLEAYKAHLAKMGYASRTVTEADYGSLTGQYPDGTAEKIWKWLKDNFIALQIKYVLLIGNPDPDDPDDADDSVGDVPMKMCWPRREEAYNRSMPTDSYYAALVCNWDCDGDGYYGEMEDVIEDKWNFYPQVYVGRISCLNGNYSAVDGYLDKLIGYESGNSSLAWRHRMLLGMGITNFENQSTACPGRIDGRNFPEYVVNNALSKNGYQYFVMYEKGGLSPVPDDAAYDNAGYVGVSGDLVLEKWNSNYGAVYLEGHGLYYTIYGHTWREDFNGNGIADNISLEFDDTDLLNFMNVDGLGDSASPICFFNACQTALPESSRTNLVDTVLARQAAVAIVAATGTVYERCDFFTPSVISVTSSDIAYDFFVNLIDGQYSVGRSLCMARKPDFNTTTYVTNKMAYNLYGPPHLYIEQSISLTNGDYHIPERDTVLYVPVTKTGGLNDASVLYDYYRGPAMDTAARLGGGQIDFEDDSLAAVLPVTLTDDAVVEAGETVYLYLHDPVNARLGKNATCVITITDNDTAALVTCSLEDTVYEYGLYTSSVHALDTALSVTITFADFPAWLDTIGSVLSGTPDRSGSYQYTVLAHYMGTYDTVAVRITVLDINDVPVITPLADDTVTAGVTYTRPVTVYDEESDTLVLTATGGPGACYFVDDTLFVPTDTGSVGDYLIVIHAADACTSVVDSFTLTVEQGSTTVYYDATHLPAGIAVLYNGFGASFMLRGEHIGEHLNKIHLSVSILAGKAVDYVFRKTGSNTVVCEPAALAGSGIYLLDVQIDDVHSFYKLVVF